MRRRSFVPAASESRLVGSTERLRIQQEVSLADAAVRNKFWWTEHRLGRHAQQLVLSTRDVVALLLKGHIVDVLSGPHDALEDAQRRADVAWESPD